MSRPTKLPLWATVSGAAIAEPPDSLKNTGWVPFQVPPAEYFNYEMNLVGQWLSYFSGSYADLLSPAVSATLNAVTGRFVLPAGSSSFVLTNSSILSNSMLVISLENNDATGATKASVPTAGTGTFFFVAPAANLTCSFQVINPA